MSKIADFSLNVVTESLAAMEAALAGGAEAPALLAKAVAHIRDMGADREASAKAIERARGDYCNDDIEIDDVPMVSIGDEGTWVQAWVFVRAEEYTDAGDGHDESLVREIADGMRATALQNRGFVTRLATSDFFTFESCGDELVVDAGLRKAVETLLGEPCVEVVYPGYAAELALVPASLVPAKQGRSLTEHHPV